MNGQGEGEFMGEILTNYKQKLDENKIHCVKCTKYSISYYNLAF